MHSQSRARLPRHGQDTDRDRRRRHRQRETPYGYTGHRHKSRDGDDGDRDRDYDRGRSYDRDDDRDEFEVEVEEEEDSDHDRLRARPTTDDRRRETHRVKAKESPATTPVRKVDRIRDREGQRRRPDDQRRHRDDQSRHRVRDSHEESPTKSGFRERRQRQQMRYDSYDDDDSDNDNDNDNDNNENTPNQRQRSRRRHRQDTEQKHQSADSTNSASHLLSADTLARLGLQLEQEDQRRAKEPAQTDKKRRKSRRARGERVAAAAAAAAAPRRSAKGRVVSGAYLEEGRSPEMKAWRRGGASPTRARRGKKANLFGSLSEKGDEGSRRPKKWLWISLGAVVLLLAVVVPVAVVVAKNHHSSANSSPQHSPTPSGSSTPLNSNLNGVSPDTIPPSARGTYLDPWTWYETDGFNITYTDETVGGLSLMGLNSTWDDSARPNDQVPPLNDKFPYGSRPIRGVNLGGWLSIEPFITPSLFDVFTASEGVVDEWTLTQQLGLQANRTIEKHYATFITEQDFANIRDAGLDHVRIQYSFWAVKTYPGNPYLAKISWRYLLRAIEYCRKYGLRVKLDIHGIPGSQNGWNHSGHQGPIGWINGSHGELNRQRSLEIHDQLSQFFAQDRYKNVLTIYGLVNEPLMLKLPVENVLNWTQEATQIVRKNGMSQYVAFSDGFLNLAKWKYMLKDGPSDNMLLDTHQYTVFNTAELALNHTAKIDLICNSWYSMIQQVNSTIEGWGPTICGEFSQADTDCAKYLNNVGAGARWDGTLANTGSTQFCPTGASNTCKCSLANASPSSYSAEYKKWLQTYAEAQMSAFSTAMGWFYWTWRTESAAQWSYSTAWTNGYMPAKAYDPAFKCGDPVPDFGDLPEYY